VRRDLYDHQKVVDCTWEISCVGNLEVISVFIQVLCHQLCGIKIITGTSTWLLYT